MKTLRFHIIVIEPSQSWAQFCCKMWGGQLSVKPI